LSLIESSPRRLLPIGEARADLIPPTRLQAAALAELEKSSGFRSVAASTLTQYFEDLVALSEVSQVALSFELSESLSWR
jgi:hypothetical protein